MLKCSLRIGRRLAPIALLLILWQIAASSNWNNRSVVPTTMQVAVALKEMAVSGELLHDSVDSLRRVLLGFAVAILAGCLIGAFFSLMPAYADWIESPLELLRPIPPVAWIPLAILWFGIGEIPAIFIVFLGAFFPILVNVVAGIRSTERLHINAARCLGATRGMILREIIFPSALPSILTGLRVGFGIGWICVITAELVGAQSGLGYMIQLNRLLLRTDKVIAGMAVIGCLGFAFNRLLVLMEKELVRWRPGSSLA